MGAVLADDFHVLSDVSHVALLSSALRGGAPLRRLDEASARQAAEDMSRDLRADGFPIRHAGSFGFDFTATEWFHDATTDQYSVRVPVSDLPTQVRRDLTVAIAQWRAHQSAGGKG